MHTQEFDFVASLVKRESGIVLAPSKEYLFHSRLAPLAKRLGMATPSDIVARLRLRPEPMLVRSVVDAMTTNESLFFRDKAPFDMLRSSVIPDLLAARRAGKQLRIWSAACSSGQEPYSIAMILEELGLFAQGWRIDILGTDISEEMIARATEARYSKIEIMRGLPVQLLVKHFTEVDGEWKINDDLRRRVRFQRFNLLQPATALGTFDIVFCRNVLIYFDKETKVKVLNSVADRLAPDGSLFLGSAETLLGLGTRFTASPRYRGVHHHSDAVGEAAAA